MLGEAQGRAAGAPLGEASVPRGPDPVETQKNWAKVWVIHGAAWLALILYCWTMWVVSGDFDQNTIGRGAEPTWYVVLVRIVEVVFGVLFTGWILWHFVIRPKLRTGRFTFDGLFFLAGWLMVFQEPWLNWTTYQFQYATTFVNFGTWLPHVPGWSSPNAELIPLPLVYVNAYLWMCAMAGYLGSKYMSYQRSKDPSRGAFRLVFQTYGVLILADIVLELIMTRFQLISYSATIEDLTLFAGTDHQFPIYEPLSWAGTWLVMACLHFFRDDQGRSWPERGIDLLRFKSDKLKTLARFAAIAGACQLAIFFTFNMPYWFYAQHAGPMPQEFIDREWRNGGVCGPTTDYPCPHPDLPIWRDGVDNNRITIPQVEYP